MNDHVKTLLDAARKLTIEEREELAGLILESIDTSGSWETAWAREAQRRWRDDVSRGEAPIDGMSAIEEARRQLKRRET